MRTVVINTSKEAKKSKLNILFKAPFDQTSLLWIDRKLDALGECADEIRQSLIENTDTVDRDYQLIVLVDLYPLPLGNDKKAVKIYEHLIERYIRFFLLENLYSSLNLAPRGVAMYFVDSAKALRGLNLDSLVDNIKEQERLEAAAEAERESRVKQAQQDKSGDLEDADFELDKKRKNRTEEQRILMEIFGWKENMRSTEFNWKMKISVTGESTIDFSEVFKDTSYSIAKSHETAAALEIALDEVLAPVEDSNLQGVGRFPVYKVIYDVERENEQSKIEGFFCVFAGIFTCVQEKMLLTQPVSLKEEQIRKMLISALKKYSYFSREENICVSFEPIEKIFKQRETICEKRKSEIKNRSEFKDKSDEDVADMIMSDQTLASYDKKSQKLRGLDQQFHEIAEDIFRHYDEEVIRKQNNRIVKSCLEGLWTWRDDQTSDSFKSLVDSTVKTSAGVSDTQNRDQKRENIAFIEEEYEAKRDDLINKVTDAEHKLASNTNILLETKDLVLEYSDWMRKGKWYWISTLGALFTLLATVFPFFYTEISSGAAGIGFRINGVMVLATCALLYAVASTVYMTYINRKKRELIEKLERKRNESIQNRRNSIIALYHYYSDTVVEAESHYLLWREILRRDRENAKKGIKRNYHINRLKGLSELVKRFSTMLKIDTDSEGKTEESDVKDYQKKCLRLDGEKPFYEQENQRVYRFLPENLAESQNSEKGGTASV